MMTNFSKKTYTYKKIGNHNLICDVYKSDDSTPKPCILWIHGGGLIFGNKEMIPEEQIELYLIAGYTLVSINYRLAPETKLEDIIRDVQDAYKWILKEGPQLFNMIPNSVSVIGHSAGGYLALILGNTATIKPQAIISFYGFGDVSSKWYNEPNSDYLKDPLVTKETAYKGVGELNISSSTFTGLNDKRWLYYLYCRQQGLLRKEVTDYDNIPSNLIDLFCPTLNISNSFPPTLFLHGDKDTDVPYEQSSLLATSLNKQNIMNEFITLKGYGHMFDIIPRDNFKGLQNPVVRHAFDSAIYFLKKTLIKHC